MKAAKRSLVVTDDGHRIDPSRIRIVPEIPRLVWIAPAFALLGALAVIGVALSDQHRGQHVEDHRPEIGTVVPADGGERP